MNVLQASKSYYPHLGGVETILRQLAEGFVSRHNISSEVLVCSDSRKSTEEIVADVKVRRISSLGRVASLPLSPGYLSALWNSSADVLLIHEPSLLASFGCALRSSRVRKKFGRIYVWWHSDIVRQRWMRPFYGPALARTLKYANGIIVATPNHISSSDFLPPYKEKCHVVPFGVDIKKFNHTERSKAFEEKLRKNCQKPIVLFIGRLVYYKGAEYAVDAMRNIPEAQLVIVGRGPLQDQLFEKAKHCPNNITFLPHLDDEEYIGALRACDVFIMPSTENSEAFGLVQLDAMACGKPVITSDLPTGVTYINRHQVTGLVVPRRNAEALAEAIRLLVNNPDLRERYGKNARDPVLKEYTLENMIDKTVKVIADA